MYYHNNWRFAFTGKSIRL